MSKVGSYDGSQRASTVGAPRWRVWTSRRSRLALLGGILALSALWGTARAIDRWRFRINLAQAKARIAAGVPADARRLLADSSVRWPGEGEETLEEAPFRNSQGGREGQSSKV